MLKVVTIVMSLISSWNHIIFLLIKLIRIKNIMKVIYKTLQFQDQIYFDGDLIYDIDTLS
jgi:hypothetical protein